MLRIPASQDAADSSVVSNLHFRKGANKAIEWGQANANPCDRRNFSAENPAAQRGRIGNGTSAQMKSGGC